MNADKWIKVEDRLPEDDQMVVIWIDYGRGREYGDIGTYYRDDDVNEWLLRGEGTAEEDYFSGTSTPPPPVTHWQPMPGGPVEVEIEQEPEPEPVERVTRDMAIDAGDPSLEGWVV